MPIEFYFRKSAKEIMKRIWVHANHGKSKEWDDVNWVLGNWKYQIHLIILSLEMWPFKFSDF